jgi:hypothetical protein
VTIASSRAQAAVDDNQIVSDNLTSVRQSYALGDKLNRNAIAEGAIV